MNFRTALTPLPLPQRLRLSDKTLSIGSCFSDKIGQYLEDFKFDILKNPFGILFNPVSIGHFFTSKLSLPDAAFCQHSERTFCFLTHSDLHAESVETLRKRIQEAHQGFWTRLQETDVIILTLGTAWCYAHHEVGVIANCHKQPAILFEKRLLTVSEIGKAVEKVLSGLSAKTQVVLTVSPVRHLKDTLEGSSVSKSTLRLAAHQLTQKYPQIHYFPAYELLLDDLRDYRFYASDLLHPSPEAIEYIWEKFQNACIDDETKAFIKRWQKVRQQLQHRPFNPESNAHKQFLERLREEIAGFQELIEVKQELLYVEDQLKRY